MSDADHGALEALDEAFYALDAIDKRLAEYVDAHPSNFFRD
jgi:hypothetical protein